MKHSRNLNVKLKPRASETAQQIVKRFRKMVDKEGVTKELKKRLFYEKPSEVKNREEMRRIYAFQKLADENNPRQKRK